MDDVDIEIEETRQELALLRAHGTLERQRQILERKEACEDIREAERRLKAMKSELTDNIPHQVYIQCIKITRDTDEEVPSYAMSLEAMVCRSVHHLVVLKKQLALLKKASDNIVDLFQGAISNITEEKGVVEMNAMNHMFALDDEKAFMKEQYTLELLEQQQALVMFAKKDFEAAAHKDQSVQQWAQAEKPDMASLLNGDGEFVNVSDNVVAVVKDDKDVSYVVRQRNTKNGWKPLSMSKATRSSVSSLNRLNRSRLTTVV